MNSVSFSGGKDSTAMLFMMLEKGIPVDQVVWCDSGKEFPAMYRHIEKVQSMIPIEITKVSFDFDYWFRERIRLKGNHRDETGYGWPNIMNRWCTGRKRQALDKVKNNSISFVGIAYDEIHRARDKNKIYPLVEWGITEKQAIDYCYSLGFDWDGLYNHFNRVSCWCCPLQSIKDFRALYNNFPELWKELQEMDQHSPRKIRKDYSVRQLTEKFRSEQALCFT